MRKFLLLLPLILTGCANVKARMPFLFKPTPVPTAAPTPKVPPVYRTPDGLKITPIDIPLDENSRILGIQKWRFKVTVPPLTKNFKQRFEWIEPGKAPQQFALGQGSWGDDNTFDLMIAVVPIEVTTGQSKKLRIYIENGSGASSSLIDNPMTNFSKTHPIEGMSTHYLQEFRNDGSCVLIKMGNSTVNPRNPKLILRLKAVKDDSFSMKYDAF